LAVGQRPVPAQARQRPVARQPSQRASPSQPAPQHLSHFPETWQKGQSGMRRKLGLDAPDFISAVSTRTGQPAEQVSA
jgi:hypothetical protein